MNQLCWLSPFGPLSRLSQFGRLSRLAAAYYFINSNGFNDSVSHFN
jgi:hypothetical protein